MVCDNCKSMAKFYFHVHVPDGGTRYWCASCADGVPSGVSRAPFVTRGVAPTLEEHLQDSIATLQQKINRLEGRIEDDRKINKTKTERLNSMAKDNRRLKARIRKLQDSAYWGPPYHSIFAAQQQQYNEMLQQRAAQMQGGLGGLGCIAPGTAMVTREAFEKEQKTLNKKIERLKNAITETRNCEIKDRCPACDYVKDQALKDTK